MGSRGTEEILAAAAEQHIDLVNNSQANNVHAYIWGKDPDHNSQLAFVQADGKTVYYPANPGPAGGPLKQDCAIPLGAPGQTKKVTIPHLKSGRVYFSIGKLHISLADGPSVVTPSETAADNHGVQWQFGEFTWDAAGVYANLSNVDLVGLPVGLALKTSDGSQKTPGLPAGGVDAVCKKLEALGGDWAKTVQKKDGKYLRAVAPAKAMAINQGLFAGYYKNYVDKVWDKYKNEDLTLHVPQFATPLTGRVVNGALVVSGGGGGPESFAQPTTEQIFANAGGPFANAGSAKRLAIIPVLCRGFERSTLLASSVLPDPQGPKAYYQHPVTDHYAKIVHAEAAKTYAFAYDDDESGPVQSNNPQLLTFTVRAP